MMKKARLLLGLVIIMILVGIGGGYTAYSRSPSQRALKYLDLGRAYLSELKYEEAVASFEAALQIDPLNNDVRDLIVDTYSAWCDEKIAWSGFEEAIVLLDQARDRFPDIQELADQEVDLYLENADLLAQSGNYDAAISLLKDGNNTLKDEDIYSSLIEKEKKKEEYLDSLIEEENEKNKGHENNTEVQLKTTEISGYLGNSIEQVKKELPEGKTNEFPGYINGKEEYVILWKTPKGSIIPGVSFLAYNGTVVTITTSHPQFTLYGITGYDSMEKIENALVSAGWAINSKDEKMIQCYYENELSLFLNQEGYHYFDETLPSISFTHNQLSMSVPSGFYSYSYIDGFFTME